MYARANPLSLTSVVLFVFQCALSSCATLPDYHPVEAKNLLDSEVALVHEIGSEVDGSEGYVLVANLIDDQRIVLFYRIERIDGGWPLVSWPLRIAPGDYEFRVRWGMTIRSDGQKYVAKDSYNVSFSPEAGKDYRLKAEGQYNGGVRVSVSFEYVEVGAEGSDG
jgi:hypothetical protein